MNYLGKDNRNYEGLMAEESSAKSEVKEDRIENANQYYAFEVEAYPDISKEIERLSELRKRNMITEEEFISREMELLSRVYIT